MAFVRCYAELNDFLPGVRRYATFPVSLQTPMSVRDVAGIVGIPHDHIDLILVNGTSVEFSSVVSNEDRIAFYPVFESFDISPVTKLRDTPLRQRRFVLDVHLGKLASHLRMLGFDSVYNNSFRDDELERIAVDEHRTLLSKDRELLERDTITRCYLVKNTDPRQQLIEVLCRFDLVSSVRLFTRCIECNMLLERVDKSLIMDRLPGRVRRLFDEFQTCRSCDRIYWKGSHFQRMKQFVDGVMKEMVAGDSG